MPMLKPYIRGGCDDCGDYDSDTSSDSEKMRGGVFGILPEKTTSKFLQDATAYFRRKIAEQKALEAQQRKEAEERARPKTVSVASRIPTSAKRVPSKTSNQIGAILPASSTYQVPDRTAPARRQIILGDTVDSSTLDVQTLPPLTQPQVEALATVEPAQAVKTVDVPLMEDPKKEEAVSDSVAEIQALLNDLIDRLELPPEETAELKEEVKTAGVSEVLCWVRDKDSKSAKENIRRWGGLDIAFIGGVDDDGNTPDWNATTKEWSYKKKRLTNCSAEFLELQSKWGEDGAYEPYRKVGESPILCRTGTKKDIAWWLIERFAPEYKRRYTEPFFGGGAIFWAKPKIGEEFINEFNPQIYDFYKRLQAGFGEAVDLMPELSHYTESVNAFGKAKWLEQLSKYYGNNYISTTKLEVNRNPEQLLQIDKIARIIIPWLRNNPVELTRHKDKYNNEYDVIKKSVKGGKHDNLVCLYWYLIAYCNGQSNSAIPLKDLLCISENDTNLIKSKETTETADGEVKEGRVAVPMMPIKKSSVPYTKLNEVRGKWFHERLQGVKITNDDALVIAPQYDRKDAFFMFDPPYEQGGGYGIGTTNVEVGGAKKKKDTADAPAPKPKAKKGEPTRKPLDESVFPFRRFVKMCDNLKGKWMVTINGSENILDLFKACENTVYGAKLWVKNKVGNSFRFEIVYANYKFRDSHPVKSREFITAPEYMVLMDRSVFPITYSVETQPTQDNIDKAIGVPPKYILKPKNESKSDKVETPHPCVDGSGIRKPPISNSILPLLSGNKPPSIPSTTVAEAPAKKARKPRAKKAEAPVEAPKNEIVEAPAKKPRKPRAKKATETVQTVTVPTTEATAPKRGRKKKDATGSGRVADMKIEDLLKLLKS